MSLNSGAEYVRKQNNIGITCFLFHISHMIKIYHYCNWQCSYLSFCCTVYYIDNTTVITLFPLHLSFHCEFIEPFAVKLPIPFLFSPLSLSVGCSLTPSSSLITDSFRNFNSFWHSTIWLILNISTFFSFCDISYWESTFPTCFSAQSFHHNAQALLCMPLPGICSHHHDYLLPWFSCWPLTPYWLWMWLNNSFCYHTSQNGTFQVSTGPPGMYAKQTDFLGPTGLVDNADWNMFDIGLIYEISCWVHSVDRGGSFSDWNINFKLMILHFFVAPDSLCYSST